MEHNNRPGRPSIGNSTLGNLIRHKREAAGLSLTRFAAELGISRPYLSRLERGEYAHPSPIVLAQIIKQLGISAEDAYAVTGYLLPKDLPSFGPYLHAKHADWPENVLQQLESFYDFLKQKYSLE
ncbi:MAG TPA: helix-turn-helix transcriptional regulator [Candidatus Saccharimonadales bacterium]|nr:helix-turn-helix transcriptional regulator [Candidatus Saccharimonadales bacterium]